MKRENKELNWSKVLILVVITTLAFVQVLDTAARVSDYLYEFKSYDGRLDALEEKTKNMGSVSGGAYYIENPYEFKLDLEL